MKRYFGIGVLSIYLVFCFISACIPAGKGYLEEPDAVIYPDFDQNIHQIVYSWQDKLESDSLIAFLRHPKSDVRFLAVQAFSSVRDKNALPYLLEMLKDSSFAVRNAAAYAIGQLGDVKGEKALTDAFISFDSIPGYQVLNATIMEALGKCGSAATLKLISETTTYIPSDTLMILGQVRGIYRFGLRNIFHPSAQQTLVKYLTNQVYSEPIRLLSAAYFYRFNQAEFTIDANGWSDLIEDIDSPSLQMFIYPLFLRTKSSEAPAKLNEWLSDKQLDDAVKINCIKQLHYLPVDEAEALAFKLARSEKDVFRQMAIEYFIQYGREGASDLYFSWKDSLSDPMSALGLVAASGRLASPYIRGQHARVSVYFSNFLEADHSIANQRKAVQLMAHCLDCLVPLKNLLVDVKKTPALRSAAAEAFAQLPTHPAFNTFYKSAATDVKIFIAKYLSLSILEEESPIVSAAAFGLSNPPAGLRLFIPDTIQWSRIRTTLQLPAQSEDFISLLQLEKYIQAEPGKPAWSPPYNNPIDWDAMRKLNDTIEVLVQTSKGDIHMSLFKKQAPASVLSFVKWMEEGKYTNITFHRVEPNFVIQGACTRGDGYGALNQSLRSELAHSRFDTEGILGLASAGNHTESQQFFITLAPTPHLDGNYTALGRVTKGMEVAKSIRPGDDIIRITYLSM